MATYISDSDFEYYNTLLKGLPRLYESRNADLFASDTPSKMAFRILVERLSLDMKSNPSANKLLLEVISCSPNRTPCNHICCPSCRSRKQRQMEQKALKVFDGVSNNNAYFLTALMPMTPFLHVANKNIDTLRKTLRHKLRTYLKDYPKSSVSIMGAFEYDLKTYNEYKVSSDRAKALFEDLGFNPIDKTPMWLPHLHAIVAPTNDKEVEAIKGIIKASIFSDNYVSYAVEMKSLRSDKDVSENISEIAKYMWKVRLQHSDNTYASKDGKGKSKYKSMFPSEHICQLVNTIKSNGSFKTLKFDVINNKDNI